ncbi:MAG: hypothetical protein JRI90_14575 [Deltaproteobacteria bacterium]|nr:hypothetical protein [Deltaproteobacteria bacterium]
MSHRSDLHLSPGELNTSADPREGIAQRKEEVMENLTGLFDHSDYGEAYDAMARHVSDMSNLDRIIFEDCDLSAGKVVAPHMNLKPYPHWLCPEYIARKIGCGLKEAADLLDCWVILDPTHEMIETFISWVKARGVEKALAYFEKLAMALAEVENMDPDDVTESPEPAYDAPDLYRYHIVGEYDDEDKTWIELQPGWYQALVKKVQTCKDLDSLAALGKETYQLNLSRSQAGVFWTEYNIRKLRLESKIELGPTARAFIQRITRANGNLASLGAWLYKAQQGEIKVSNPPEKHEWTVIWKA